MHLSRSLFGGLALIALLSTVAAAQGTMGKMAMGKTVTVQLRPQSNSGEHGTATLTQVGPDLQVKIALAGAPAMTSQPVHIHDGTCTKLDPTPKYPLNNVVKGKSTTVLKDVKLSTLTSGSYAINAHKSLAMLTTYVACGDIK
jgi:hypothetical protein